MARNTTGLRKGGGRPPGAPNKATRELKAFWGEFFESETYRRNLMTRILRGKAELMEKRLKEYVYGVPKATLQLEGDQARPLVLDLVTTREQIQDALSAQDDDADDRD